MHLDLPSLNTRSFMDVLQTYELHQHVSFPTHVHGHWLNLFITRSTCINFKAKFPTDGLSDHHCVIIDLWLQVGSISRKKLSHFDQTLQSFTPATTNEVLIINKKYPNKSCDLDPFPTLLLKSCIDQLIFPITTIINLSMQSGVVPQDFKQALVNPLVRNQTLCKNYLKNYRPISNLGKSSC